MSSKEAAEIREAPALKILTDGIGNVNRVVDAGDWGLVIDRRSKPQVFSLHRHLESAIPQPHYEYETLRRLNKVGASITQNMYYASPDGTKMIVQYIPGETITVERFDEDPEIRDWYARRSVEMMRELAALAPHMAPGALRRDSGFWPAQFRDTAHFTHEILQRIDKFWYHVIHGKQACQLLRLIGSVESISEDLRSVNMSRNRDLTFLHNDLHPGNVVRHPPRPDRGGQTFTVIDWESAIQGDVLLDASITHAWMRTEHEKRSFLDLLHDELPPSLLTGFDHDWGEYQRLIKLRARAVGAGIITKYAEAALEAGSHIASPSARREAIIPYAHTIHFWSSDFAGHQVERTPEETGDLVFDYVNQRIDQLKRPGALPRARMDLALAPTGQPVRLSQWPVTPGPPPRATARAGAQRDRQAQHMGLGKDKSP